jgi:serum/glucocorticoid-regulated kinase 2
LEYIHANRIIHKDIKPENIVFEENGYVRITDFGIAKSELNDSAMNTRN